MEELTIEEKAKAYDKAIDRAKKWYNAPNIDKIPTFGNRVIEEIFPELQESEDEDEDERIRKGIIKYLEQSQFGEEHYCVDDDIVRDYIAWLEKQKAVDILDEEEREFADNVDSYRKEVDAAYQKGYNEGVKATLEKQDKKPADKVEPKDYNSIDPHFGKPADKVEPKFQNGQWIVWQDKCYKVNYNGCGYELIDQNGLNTSLEYGTVDESAHVWDITKDAKDGDILADNVGVILFKSIGDNNVINFHAYFSGLFAVQEGEHYWGHVRECTLSPATKEQRDTFEKAMVDAGWEFDFEKKELKKISQRMISAEAKEAMYGKPAAWSEEDERIFRTIISDGIRGAEFDMLQINWLKSLKQRIKL